METHQSVKAYPEQGTGFLTFWCDYCKKEHLHGRGDGHRSAHCAGHYTRTRQVTTAEGSPFAKTGYFLNEALVMGVELPNEQEMKELNKANSLEEWHEKYSDWWKRNDMDTKVQNILRNDKE